MCKALTEDEGAYNHLNLESYSKGHTDKFFLNSTISVVKSLTISTIWCFECISFKIIYPKCIYVVDKINRLRKAIVEFMHINLHTLLTNATAGALICFILNELCFFVNILNWSNINTWKYLSASSAISVSELTDQNFIKPINYMIILAL